MKKDTNKKKKPTKNDGKSMKNDAEQKEALVKKK